MADRYWVGGTASWDATVGTKWATTSGGAGGASVPTASDNVFINAASGAVTVTLGSAQTCLDLDFTGFTGTFNATIPSLFTISGSLKMVAGMTFVPSSNNTAVWTFAALTGSRTITTGGKALWNVRLGPGAGVSTATFQLLDSYINLANARVILDRGTFDLNGQTITVWQLNCSTLSIVKGNASNGGLVTIVGQNTAAGGAACGVGIAILPLFINCTFSGASATRNIGGPPGVIINVTAGTDTVDTGFSTGMDINFTGFSGTWAAGTGICNINSLTISTGMTVTASTFALTLGSTAAGTGVITSNGKTLDRPVTVNSTGTIQLADDMTVGASRTLTVSAGTFDLNNKNLSTGLAAVSAGTVLMGSGTITLTAAGTVWNLTGTPTITPGTSTIKITDASATAKTFAGGGKTYNHIWLTGAGAGTFDFTGSNTFNDFKCDTPPHSIRFTAGTTTTVATFTVNGTVGNLMTIGSITAASHALVKSGGGSINNNYLSVSRSDASPASWAANFTSTNGGNNTGWTFGSYSLLADAGAFTVSGQAATFVRRRIMHADVGAFILNGIAAGFLYGRAIKAGVGAFFVAGVAAVIKRENRTQNRSVLMAVAPQGATGAASYQSVTPSVTAVGITPTVVSVGGVAI